MDSYSHRGMAPEAEPLIAAKVERTGGTQE